VAEVTSGARDGLTSVTRGTLVMLLGTLGFVAESFIARVLLIRVLTPDEWAQFFVGLTLAGLLTALGTLGLPQAVARSLPFEASIPERRTIVRTSFLVVIPAAVAVSGLMALASWPLATRYASPLLAETLVFFAAAVGLSILGALIASIFQGYEDVWPNALFIQVLNPSLFIVFLVAADLVTPLQGAYTAALGAYLLAGVATMIALLVYTRRKLPKLLPPGPRDPKVSRKLVQFALPLFVVSAMTYIAGNGDALLLAVFNRSAVAYYSADLSLARLLQVGIGSLAYIILPVTARFIRSGDTASIRTTYTTATKWMVLASLPPFLLFFFYPTHSLAFVYGKNYVVSPLPLQILVLGALISTVVGPSASAQVAFGQTRYLLFNTIVAGVTDVALSLWLIPILGITGAAIAWGTAAALYPVLSMVELAALADVHPFRRHFLVPLIATSVPIALLLTLLPVAPPLWTLPAIVVGIAGLFILVVLMTGSLDDGDRLLLEAVERLVGRPFPLLRRIGARFLPRSAPTPVTPAPEGPLP
jgi:O-antigen/teichoic acid export membrane protein